MKTAVTPMARHDCKPTLTDQQVIEFCRQGYLELPAVVAPQVCAKIREYFHEQESRGDMAEMSNADALLKEDWFVQGMVLCPPVIGAIRSLLGANFGLPSAMSNHPGKCPDPDTLNWHIDGGNMHTFALNYLQVFCMPQDTTVAMGPTQILPGSHFLLTQSSQVDHYGAIVGAKKCIGPAGTVIITCYPIWHRRYKATASGCWRQLLKYSYFRHAAPTRDWVIEEDFDPACFTTDFSIAAHGANSYRRNFLDAYDAARMYMWLCGHEDEFKYVGGIAWPGPLGPEADGTRERYAVPPSLLNGQRPAYQPDAMPMFSKG